MLVLRRAFRQFSLQCAAVHLQRARRGGTAAEIDDRGECGNIDEEIQRYFRVTHPAALANTPIVDEIPNGERGDRDAERSERQLDAGPKCTNATTSDCDAIATTRSQNKRRSAPMDSASALVEGGESMRTVTRSFWHSVRSANVSLESARVVVRVAACILIAGDFERTLSGQHGIGAGGVLVDLFPKVSCRGLGLR